MKSKVYYYHGTVYGEDWQKFTIAGTYIDNCNTLLLNIAICNTTDQFIKKIGRQLAEDRLYQNDQLRPNLSIPLNVNNVYYQLAYKVIRQVIYENRDKLEGFIFQQIVSGMCDNITTRKQLLNLFHVPYHLKDTTSI